MRRLILAALTSALALMSSTLLGAQYEEGVHYQVLDPQAPLSTSGEGIEVSEYFSYGCGHCFQFDPVLNAWLDKQPEDVNFDRTPAVWNDYYGNLAQTYYTLKAMDVLESLHVAVFEAIHIQRKNLSKPGVMADFLEEAGVDPEAFAKVFNSFGVRMSLQQADARQSLSGIRRADTDCEWEISHRDPWCRKRPRNVEGCRISDSVRAPILRGSRAKKQSLGIGQNPQTKLRNRRQSRNDLVGSFSRGSLRGSLDRRPC